MTDTMKEANSINIMPADVEEVRRSLGQIKKAIQASKMDVVYNASVGAGNPALAWLLIWIGAPEDKPVGHQVLLQGDTYSHVLISDGTYWLEDQGNGRLYKAT